MTTQTPPKPPPIPLSERLARRVLSQMGENGKPPELGISHVNVGNESYLDLLDSFYVERLLRDTDGSTFKLVQGTYGAGKTHFLYCVRERVWRKNLLTSFVTVSPKETPLHRPLSVYQAVARQLQLPREGESDTVIKGVDDVVRHNIEERLEKEGRDDVMRWANRVLARAPIEQHAFRDALVAYVHALVNDEGPEQRLLAAWLRGEDTGLAQVKKQGVYEVPSNRNGFSLLRSLVQSVVQLGYEGSALLFDEAERRLSIEAIRVKSTREAMDHLRELVDLCGRSELPRTLLLYAVTPAFVHDVLPEYPALQQRLGAPIQYLSSHNPRAPLIDLEALDLDPRRLLTEVGQKLARVSGRAHGWKPNPLIVTENLEQLVRTVTEQQLEVSHRRLFVKLWIRLLDELRLGGNRVVTESEVQGAVRGEQANLLADGPTPSSSVTFFGQPVRTRS